MGLVVPSRRNFLGMAAGSSASALANQIDILRPRMPRTFGTSSWASLLELRRAGMLQRAYGKRTGPILGCLTPAEVGGRDIHYVYANHDHHLATFAPSGAGKTRGQIKTNLLWYPGSTAVLDIKGENHQDTSGWRQANGHNVVNFAPHQLGSARWNVFDYINDGCGKAPNDMRRQEKCRYIASLAITPNPQAKEPYFDNAAKSLLQGLIMFVATAPVGETIEVEKARVCVRERTMGEVYRLLMQRPQAFRETLTVMANSPEDWVSQTAATLLRMEAAREQFASVTTILMEHMAVWSYDRVKQATAKSDFSFEQLRVRNGSNPTTIYLNIPPEDLAEYKPLLRVMVGCCTRQLRESWSPLEDDKLPSVLLMLDEFPQLGRLEPIEQALLYMRSYAVRFWFFCQSTNDLQKHYPDSWKGLIANCSKVFSGVADYDTAKLVSDMTGAETVRNHSYQAGSNESETDTHGSSSSSSWGPGGSSSSSGSFSSRSLTVGSSFSVTQAYVGRPLIMPDEVLRMPFGSMIGLTRGMAAMRGQLRFWDEDPELRRRGMTRPSGGAVKEG